MPTVRERAILEDASACSLLFLSKSIFYGEPTLASPQTGMLTVRQQAILEAASVGSLSSGPHPRDLIGEGG